MEDNKDQVVNLTDSDLMGQDMVNDLDIRFPSQGAHLNARVLEFDLYSEYFLSDHYEEFSANMSVLELIDEYGFDYDFEKDCNPIGSWPKHLRDLSDDELAEVKAVVEDFRAYVENWEPSDD